METEVPGHTRWLGEAVIPRRFRREVSEERGIHLLAKRMDQRDATIHRDSLPSERPPSEGRVSGVKWQAHEMGYT